MNARPNPTSVFPIALAAIGAIFLAAGCVDRKAQDIAKQTAALATDPTKLVAVETPKSEEIRETVDVSGDITTGQDVSVGFKAGGLITAVNVKDGDAVTAGQVIATLDSSTALSQLRSAQSQLAQAQAQYSQQLSNARLNPAKSAAAVRQAEAALRSQRANLTKALRGARPEERAQAQAQVTSAKSNLDTARTNRDRISRLVKEGALAQSQLDTAQNQFEVAQAAYNEAVQALATLTNGTRAEDVSVAREAVRQAEQELTSARATQKLDVTLQDAVDAAKGAVDAARAQVQIAQQGVTDTVLRAPFSGRILGKPLQVGTVVQAGGAVVRIIGSGGIYFEGEVPSSKVTSVQSGQAVDVRVDALPGKLYQGVVSSVAPQGETTGRIFNARITFPSAAEAVKPGMFARGAIVIRQNPNALTLPTSAIFGTADARYVMLNDNGKAKRQNVKVGITRGDRSEVTGISPTAPVIIRGGADLVEGDKLKVESPEATADRVKSVTGAADGATGATGGEANSPSNTASPSGSTTSNGASASGEGGATTR